METHQISPGYLFLNDDGPKRDNITIARMPSYREPQMTTAEANLLEWEGFKQRIKPIGSVGSASHGIEFILTEKSTPWTVEDVNLWAGGDRPTNVITDFCNESLADLFRIHSCFVDEFNQTSQALQWGFGFNSSDFSPGHHSVARFHTHIRGLGNPLDRENLITKSWKESSWYERLTTVEPFAPIAFDIVSALLKEPETRSLGWHSPVLKRGGYISFEMDPIKDYMAYARAFSNLYRHGEEVYNAIQDIFTDGYVEPVTERPCLRPICDRRERLGSFMAETSIEFSPRSKSLLGYIAENAKPAKPRVFNGRVEIRDASQVHITKGFAGGFMFTSLAAGENYVDFFPRIITTTGPTKNLHGDGRLYGFTKTSDKPTQGMLKVNQEFKSRMADIMSRITL